MKYLLAFSFFCIISFQWLGAQVFQTSAAIDNADLGYTFVMGRIENRTFVISRKASRFKTQYYLTAFDALGLGQIWQKEMALGKDIEQILKVWTKDNKLHLLAHQYANGRSEIRYIQYGIDGQIIATKSLFQIEANNGLDSKKSIQLSADYSKVAIATNWNRQSNWLGVYDLEKDYLLWSSESKIAIEKDLHVDIQEVCITNFGDLYLTLRDKQSEYYIYHIKAEEGAPLIYTLGVQQIALSEPKMAYNQQQNSLFIIFFLQQRGNYAYGIQYLRLTQDGTLFRHKEIFKEDFVLKTTNKKKAARKGIYAIEIKDIQFDGEEVWIVGEQFAQSTIHNNNSIHDPLFYPSYAPLRTFNNNDYEYWHGALVLMKYKNDKVNYSHIIPKEQTIINDNGLLGSYFLYKGDKALNFIYSKIVRHKWHIEAYSIDKATIIKNTVLPMPGGMAHIAAQSATIYDESNMYLLGVDGKDIHLLKFNLQKVNQPQE